MSLGAVALTMVVVTLLTMLSLRCFRRLAISKSVVSRPNPLVRSHTDSVPYLGGPALFAVLLPALIWAATSARTSPNDDPEARWICTTCVLAIGLFDDLRPLSVVEKLLALLAVCSAYLIAVGSSEPFNVVRFGLELAFMLLIVNAFNLVDVMDGLLIVIGSVAAIGLLGGSFLTSPLNRIECEILLATLVAAFWFNRPPARIYLGDAGALAVGFFLASLYLAGSSGSMDPDGFAHLGAFAIPLFELALVVPARVHRRLSPLRGSPDHFSLRLQDQGSWTRERVLLATIVIGLFFDVWCFVPTVSIRGPTGIALTTVSIALGVAAYRYCWQLVPRTPLLPVLG